MELQLHLGVLQQHAALIGGPNATSCPICHKLFLGSESLIDHMKHVHKEKKTSSGIASDGLGMSIENGEVIESNGNYPPLISTNSGNSENLLAKRRVANHPCPICGKHYVNEGSLRKHLASHSETSQLTSSLRMWPCSVCQAVFTHENGLLTHMEHMRMDPKHQFAAQYVLSRAAAERRERENLLAASITVTGAQNSSMIPLMNEGNGNQSDCPSPSGNSECSSNERLSSTCTSDQESNPNILNNNNNDNSNKCNNISPTNNKISVMLGNRTDHPMQNTYDSETHLQVANRMSLMAVASAAAASSGNISNSPSERKNSDESNGSRIHNSGSVQAAVVNLAAALRINQQNNSDSEHNLSVNGISCHSPHEPRLQHQQQIQATTDASSDTHIHGRNNRRNSPLGLTSDSSVHPIATMTSIRDTMLRTDQGGLNHQMDQSHLIQSSQPHNIQNTNHFPQHPSLQIPSHQSHLQQPLMQNSLHPPHNLLCDLQQTQSSESAVLVQQHAEALFRSHTEAAFRIAASVAASNGSQQIPTDSVANSIDIVNCSNSLHKTDTQTIQNLIDGRNTQQQHHHLQNEPQSLSHSNTTCSIAGQAHSTSNVSISSNESIRQHDSRLEQTSRLHTDNRSLSFTQPPLLTNSGLSSSHHL